MGEETKFCYKSVFSFWNFSPIFNFCWDTGLLEHLFKCSRAFPDLSIALWMICLIINLLEGERKDRLVCISLNQSQPFLTSDKPWLQQWSPCNHFAKVFACEEIKCYTFSQTHWKNWAGLPHRTVRIIKTCCAETTDLYLKSKSSHSDKMIPYKKFIRKNLILMDLLTTERHLKYDCIFC